MIRLACWGVAFVAAALIVLSASRTFAQEEVEIITEPPPSVEPPPAEPTEPEPSPEEAPTKVEPTKQKLGQLRVGAGIGFGFANSLITFGIAPQVSYVFKRIVEPGVSIRYQYTNDKLIIPNAVWHTLGASIFTRIYPIPSIFVLIEGEIINTGYKRGGVSSGRTNYGNLFLGGGYVMGVGRGAFVAVSIKVNVFRNAFYPGNIPIFGVGAGFGF